jgi:hypothetical protein
MATPTSSSNRSKRKSNKPVTQGQNPQRSNRQKVSNAKVSNADQRTNTGSAKVTKGATPKPADPWNKPAPKNSRTNANTNANTRGRAVTNANVDPKNYMPNSQRRGINLPQAANNAMPPKSGPSLRGTTPGSRTTTPAKPSGSFKAPSIPKSSPASTPKPAAKPSAAKSPLSRVGKAGVITMALGAANAADDARLTPAQLKKKYEVVDPNRGQRVADNLLGRNQTPKPKQGNAQSRFAGSRDANLNRINNDPRFAAPKPAAKPKPPTPTQSGGGSTQSRSGGGGSSRPAAPAPRRQPGPAADAGMKNQDKNYKGSYLQKFKEESGRMSAASMSRQQGRSNLTASDLKPKSEKTLREKMDELKKRRSGNSFGGL